jgi:lysophospholipase L1-like esterase
MKPLDVCVDGVLHASVPLAGRESFAVLDLPAGEKAIELWLPQFGRFRLLELTLDDGATLSPFADRRRRWLTYGSSITQCRDAASPTLTWPAIVARDRDLNLTCLGYGGQCHLDPMIARLIRDQPADYISICAGINIYGGASLGPRTFLPALIGTVRTIREWHPETPLALISPIFSPSRETTPNAAGMTLQAYRDDVAAAVEALESRGDTQIFYVDGLSLFGPDLAEHLPDGLHPDTVGYRHLAENFLRVVGPRLFV